MLIDDYANTDTPDVTRAVNLFLEWHEDCIQSIDTCDRWFKNKGKHIPVCSKVVFIYKERESKKRIFAVHGETERQWYIWGMGNIAKKFWERCGKKTKISGVLDNYEKASEWNGLPLCSLSKVAKENSVIIIATDIYYNEIKEQLIKAGLQDWKDFIKYSAFEEYYINNWYVIDTQL